MIDRQVFIISDLHLGGVYGSNADDRGFRINTHVSDLVAFINRLTARPGSGPEVELVINGDLVDFLAESGAGEWLPFTADEPAAVAKLEAIIGRDRAFFDALAAFLKSGKSITLLLGNHDIELSMPAVRASLQRALGVNGESRFRFIYNGEAYIVGDALIEHGNRYDSFNVVDYGRLRQIGSLLSRRQSVPPEYACDPPAGSKMVAWVINPIKNDYRFIDLLKPETDAVIPFLLALEPGYRKILGTVAKLSLQARRHGLQAPALPEFGGDIASGTSESDVVFGGDISSFGGPASADSAEDRELEELLSRRMGPTEARQFLSSVDGVATPAIGQDISTMDVINRGIGLAKLLFSSSSAAVDSRLPALLQAIRVLQSDRTFDETTETEPAYLHAAEDLAQGGFRYVIFGHTHLRKRVPMSGGGFYLNSGTWVDLMRVPSGIVNEQEAAATPALQSFVSDISSNKIASYLLYQPTYVRLDLENDRVVNGNIFQYQAQGEL